MYKEEVVAVSQKTYNCSDLTISYLQKVNYPQSSPNHLYLFALFSPTSDTSTRRCLRVKAPSRLLLDCRLQQLPDVHVLRFGDHPVHPFVDARSAEAGAPDTLALGLSSGHLRFKSAVGVPALE